MVDCDWLDGSAVMLATATGANAMADMADRETNMELRIG
jgi:hypothetical protein